MLTYGREAIDLCGIWGFYPDPFERGLRQKWYQNSRNPSTVFPCYDDYANMVKVPHAWNAHNIELRYYDGTCMYLKEFQLENVEQIKKEKEVWICFDGVNYHAEIYLNGHLAGTHDGGYSPFQINITPYISEQNRLWMAVNNRNQDDRVPALIYDWWNDGGVFRPVKIIFTPKTYIENYRISTNIKKDVIILNFALLIGGYDNGRQVEYTILVEELNLEIKGKATVKQEEKNETILKAEDISLWSPKNPKLYNIVIKTNEDCIYDEIGFREIRTEGREILLNGKPIFLKGINFHDEYKEYGRSPKKEYIEEAFATFKDLGLNFIRMAHYPHNEEFVRKADREGMLLWAEIPVYWYVYWENKGVFETAKRMMLEMIDRDKNRASVIVWSVGNEMPQDVSNAQYLIKLVEETRKADATRLISYACSWFKRKGQEPEGHPGMPDDLYNTLDIISINNYSGNNKLGEPEDLDFIINGYAKFGKPVIMSEFGSFSKRGYENGLEDAVSEEAHVDIFTRQINAILGNRYIRGVSPWQFNDNRTPLYHLKQANQYDRYGLTDECWRPKKAYYVYKKILEQYEKNYKKS